MAQRMKDDILAYREMCDLENVQILQRGMNYRLNPNYTVILMSQRTNAPYDDKILEDGVTIVYEGHDIPKTEGAVDPKTVDQRLFTATGKPTQNGRFVDAVNRYKKGRKPEIVRAYEKLLNGVWSFRGVFNLIDYDFTSDGTRRTYRFTLRLADDENYGNRQRLKERSRIIPTEIKKEVWIRDSGKCVLCGSANELHFDHDIPYSKGGSSISVDNVRILCARHNLQKSDKIE